MITDYYLPFAMLFMQHWGKLNLKSQDNAKPIKGEDG